MSVSRHEQPDIHGQMVPVATMLNRLVSASCGGDADSRPLEDRVRREQRIRLEITQYAAWLGVPFEEAVGRMYRQWERKYGLEAHR